MRRATCGRHISETGSKHFYPRSPCGERRPARVTPTASRNFYPRSPCGERRNRNGSLEEIFEISIHALLAESDKSGIPGPHLHPPFLSTLSLRRATAPSQTSPSVGGISIHALLAESDYGALKHVHQKEISIHALLAESDRFLPYGPMTRQYFYPRSPCGERPAADRI